MHTNSSFGGVAISGQQYMGATTQAQDPGALSSMTRQLEETLKIYHDVLCRVRALSDRVIGSQPEPVGESKGTSIGGSCAVGKLEQVCGYLSVTASDLAQHLTRLERL